MTISSKNGNMISKQGYDSKMDFERSLETIKGSLKELDQQLKSSDSSTPSNHPKERQNKLED